jgi:hypothetical protein
MSLPMPGNIDAGELCFFDFLFSNGVSGTI